MWLSGHRKKKSKNSSAISSWREKLPMRLMWLSRHTERKLENSSAIDAWMKKHHCDSRDYQAMTRGNLKIHQQSVHEGKNIHVSHLTTRAQSVHEGKKYPCCSRDYQATERRSLKTHQFMTARNTHVAHVIIKAYRKETWKLISNQCMKGRNNTVAHVMIKPQWEESWKYISNQFMMEKISICLMWLQGLKEGPFKNSSAISSCREEINMCLK